MRRVADDSAQTHSEPPEAAANSLRSVAMRQRALRPSGAEAAETTWPKGRRSIVTVAAIVVFLVAGCSGQRPELVTETGQGVGTSTDGADTAPDVALLQTDCATAIGGRPWPVIIEATPEPPMPCVELAGHHRIEFVNNTPDPVGFGLAGLTVDIEPGASFVTEPAATFLQPGLTELNATPHPVSGLWVADPSENTLAGQTVAWNSIGPVLVGATPAEITAALGGATVAAAAESCSITGIVGDPYSPVFTFSNGTLAVIRVSTPGQVTPSEVGVGSSEGDVLAAYGQQIESQTSPDGDPANNILILVPADPADQQYRLVFEVSSGVVTGLRAGLTDLTIAGGDCPG